MAVDPQPKSTTEHSLRALIGREAFLALVEAYGGRRIYVPKGNAGVLYAAIGTEAALKMSREFNGNHVSVPVAREFRARHYRSTGMNNFQIADRLGISVNGVEKLFRRLRQPEKHAQFVSKEANT